MPITKHDKQTLDQIYSDWSSRYKGRTEDYFVLIKSKKFKCEVEDIANELLRRLRLRN